MNKENSVRGSVPLYLNKINSDKKAIECANIIEAGHPTHSERLWLVGFMKFAGYSMPEVLDIIHSHCHWTDFNDRITAYQVGTVFHQRPKVGTSTVINRTSPRVRKWDLTPVEVLRIKRQHSISLSTLLCEEHPIEFPHPERLVSSEFNPTAEFLRK